MWHHAASRACQRRRHRRVLHTASTVLAAAACVLAHAAEVAQISHAYAGMSFEYRVQPGDTIGRLSSRFGQASADIARNNGVPRNAKLQPGTALRIDNRHIVPKWMEWGILINIPQRMLFRFENNQLTAAYPVGLGRSDWPTPTGRYAVISMQENKTWFVPKAIQDEMRRKGLDVKTSVPPGPENPLGRFWIGTSAPGIGIHGTNAPASIYGFHSHGCIRLNAADAARLFTQTTKGMPVEIIYQPLMLAHFSDRTIHVEVHRDAYRGGADRAATARAMAAAAGLNDVIDWDKLTAAVREQAGALRDITASAPTARR